MPGTCDLWSVASRNIDQRVKCKENRPDPIPRFESYGWRPNYQNERSDPVPTYSTSL
jgi:hypothetical protein